MSGEFETELVEFPSSWKTEYNLWHPNRQSMSDNAEGTVPLPGRSTGQRRRGDGRARASSDLGGHRVGGGGGDSGSRRPDGGGGDALDGRMNRTEGWTLVSRFLSYFLRQSVGQLKTS